MTDRPKLIEVMAKGLCVWGHRATRWEHYKPEAVEVLAALEAAGVRLVPESVTPKMAVCLESNFSVCEPASEIHAANWRSAYRAMLAASPYAPEAKE